MLEASALLVKSEIQVKKVPRGYFCTYSERALYGRSDFKTPCFVPVCKFVLYYLVLDCLH